MPKKSQKKNSAKNSPLELYSKRPDGSLSRSIPLKWERAPDGDGEIVEIPVCTLPRKDFFINEMTVVLRRNRKPNVS